MSRQRDVYAEAFLSDETLGTTLLVICMDMFGTEFFDWEPITLDAEVMARLGVDIPDVNKDKLWSLVTALTTDLFYHSLETFIPTCNALNGSEADFDNYDPVNSEEAAWGIVEVTLIDPPEEGEPADRFSHEIKRYVALTLQAEGITTPPLFLKPYTEYDEDPEEEAGIAIGPDEHMLAMHTRRQTDSREELEGYVRDQLTALLAQLKALPMSVGSSKELGQFIQSANSILKGLPTPEEAAPVAL